MARALRPAAAPLLQHERHEDTASWAIKAKLDAGIGDEEAYALLATDGMLVKRPIIVTDNAVLTGFKEAAWEEALL